MDNLKLKVLQDLIDSMDEREVSGLKSKFPNKVEVSADSPESLKEGLEMASEMPMEESEEGEDSDKMKKLMEMYQSLK